jgi:hypothetical protein
MMFTADFVVALQRSAAMHQAFLMVGRRWDADVTEAWDFDQREWQQRLRALALQTNKRRPAHWIDYFAFSRGLYYRKIVPLVVGRAGWDNWLIWYTRSIGARVVDVSPVVTAVHQNHDYGHLKGGRKEVFEIGEGKTNKELVGPWWRYHTTDDATHVMTFAGIRRSHRHWLATARRGLEATPAWYTLLRITAPLRHPWRAWQQRKAG